MSTPCPACGDPMPYYCTGPDYCARPAGSVLPVTLTEFLLVRIAEDEAVAQEATPGPWRDTPMGSEGSIVQAGGFTITTARKPATCREFSDATHIARHDPARVLAECAAKRQIVQWHTETEDCCEERWGPMQWATDENISAGTDALGNLSIRRDIGGEEWLGCVTLAYLALPYADHPDYREEWKP